MEQNDAVLRAESWAKPNQASIFSSFSGVTFIQLWRMPSPSEQQEWLEEAYMLEYKENPMI